MRDLAVGGRPALGEIRHPQAVKTDAKNQEANREEYGKENDQTSGHRLHLKKVSKSFCFFNCPSNSS
jgi:hypothetical protein